MSGLVESLLTRRYGQPLACAADPFVKLLWNDSHEPYRCVLYGKMIWDEGATRRFGVLQPMYGDKIGGSLLRGALKMAMLTGPEVYGLYQIEDLQRQPEVLCALKRDPVVHFFMDAANVWYYGVKGEHLYVYDAETDEFDLLGSVDREIELLLEQWEKAAEACDGPMG